MNYNNIKLFDFIIAEVFSAGGDGDCTIICKEHSYNHRDLANTFYGYLSKQYNNYHLDVIDDEYIISDRSNESWTFTYTDKNTPSWCQCLIKI